MAIPICIFVAIETIHLRENTMQMCRGMMLSGDFFFCVLYSINLNFRILWTVEKVNFQVRGRYFLVYGHNENISEQNGKDIVQYDECPREKLQVFDFTVAVIFWVAMLNGGMVGDVFVKFYKLLFYCIHGGSRGINKKGGHAKIDEIFGLLGYSD